MYTPLVYDTIIFDSTEQQRIEGTSLMNIHVNRGEIRWLINARRVSSLKLFSQHSLSVIISSGQFNKCQSIDFSLFLLFYFSIPSAFVTSYNIQMYRRLFIFHDRRAHWYSLHLFEILNLRCLLDMTIYMQRLAECFLNILGLYKTWQISLKPLANWRLFIVRIHS